MLVHCSNGATVSFLFNLAFNSLTPPRCVPDGCLVASALDAGVPLSPETLRHQLQLQLLITSGAEVIRQPGQDLVKTGEGFLFDIISIIMKQVESDYKRSANCFIFTTLKKHIFVNSGRARARLWWQRQLYHCRGYASLSFTVDLRLVATLRLLYSFAH